MQNLFFVNSFSDRPFGGNPAAVCVLESPASDSWMKLVAREMNLSETAFVAREGDDWRLRWFTPTTEVDLCGHATLATAFVLWERKLVSPDDAIHFQTRSGQLICRQNGPAIEMDFPVKPVSKLDAPYELDDILGCSAGEQVMVLDDLLVEVANADVLRSLKLDFAKMSKLPVRGVIVTCQDDNGKFDFLSRFFAPAVGVNEDPVTGSAHCGLAPYWAEKLQKNHLRAWQASERGGAVTCTLKGDRVVLSGTAIMMSEVHLLHGPAGF
ncbi:MAG: PhzF family phenazine biosynthesis protein [Pirellulaceae bacterium]